MRIGLVCPYTLSRPGGVQGQVLGLARSLRRLDQDVRVLGPCDGAPPEPGIIALGNSVPIEANGSVAALAPDPAAQLRVFRALWDESFDVVNLHEPFAPGPTSTTLLIERAPIVGTFHAAGTSTSYRYLAPVLRHFAERLAVRVAVSKDARTLAASALGGTYLTLFNGVELDRYDTAAPWPTEAPTILFLGRHEPRKGLGLLLEAFAGLDLDARLWVGGDGPATTELRDRFDHDRRITWLGRITEEQKIQRLRGADVFCAPSLGGESFGVVLLEAMAAGTAVVASDLPGYRNAARPDVDALLTPPGDVVALRSALHRVLDDPGRRGELVAAGEGRAASMSMDHLAELYLEIFGSLQRVAPRRARRDGRSIGWFRRGPRIRA